MTAVQPLVDVIIPLHDAARPIARAVASVTEAPAAEHCRVTVVCHGIPTAAVAERLGAADAARVRLLEFADGVPSPAGPFNHGLDAATAAYVCRLDSDDWLDPGAMAAWVEHVRAHRPDVLIARMRPVGGPAVRNPVNRPYRTERLDPVRDRLAYRTAPLGLLKLATVRRLGARMAPGLRTGEDLEMGLKLWFLSERVDLGGPACYVIGDDALVRATNTRLPLAEELRAGVAVAEAEWVQTLSADARAAIATKLVRTSVFGAMLARPAETDWPADALAALRDAARRVTALSARVSVPLSRAEARLLVAATSATTAQQAATAVSSARTAPALDRVVTAAPLRSLARDSTLRRYIRYRLPG